MIKDTFFSFSRFGKLFYKEISENWKLYGLQVLVMYVAMAITLIWYSYTDYTSFNTLAKTNDLNVHIFTLVFWMWSWWIFICLGTSFAFKTMKGKTGRITMLMTPVTAFEKFFFRKKNFSKAVTGVINIVIRPVLPFIVLNAKEVPKQINIHQDHIQKTNVNI